MRCVVAHVCLVRVRVHCSQENLIFWSEVRRFRDFVSQRVDQLASLPKSASSGSGSGSASTETKQHKPFRSGSSELDALSHSLNSSPPALLVGNVSAADRSSSQHSRSASAAMGSPAGLSSAIAMADYKEDFSERKEFGTKTDCCGTVACVDAHVIRLSLFV